uniref:Uncharacterized protein n=1 Tax=Oreochromis aureus TaxID=47969 RepID=A0AAZ1Y0S8_OREAU
MLSFPPHCSHRLQPLDRSVYGPLKRHINSTNVFLEAEFAPSYVTDRPIPDPALPGPSTNSDLPGPSTTSALPGPSTTSALPGPSTNSALLGPSTNSELPSSSTISITSSPLPSTAITDSGLPTPEDIPLSHNAMNDLLSKNRRPPKKTHS